MFVPAPPELSERDRLAALVSAGSSLEQIAERVGRHPSTVGYWLKRHGLEAAHADRHARRGAPDRELLEKLASSGATLREMGQSLNRSITTIRYWLGVWEIARPSRSKVDPAIAPLWTERRCQTHGWTRFRLESTGYYRCSRCRQAAVSKRRRKVKSMLVEESGGRCVACGYDRCQAALQFHHVDPTTKSFSLSQEGVTRGLELAREEVAKCVLLCATCHAEVESGYRMLDI
jgi:transposase